MYKSDDVLEVLSTKRGERQTPRQQDRLSSSKIGDERAGKQEGQERIALVVECRWGRRWGKRITTAAAVTTAKEGRRGGGGGGGEEGKRTETEGRECGVVERSQKERGKEGREQKEEERKKEKGGGEEKGSRKSKWGEREQQQAALAAYRFDNGPLTMSDEDQQ